MTNFILPQRLGYVRDSWTPEYRIPSTENRIVIHIQDAHCNYAAQHKIADIIAYMNREYGIDTVNLEGGEGAYDLSIFTDVREPYIRQEVSDYFVKEGLVSGAEYFAINHPGTVTLWGIEDRELYLRNLAVYRDSLRHKETIDTMLEELDYFLDNLKRHAYSRELLEFDRMYARYKTDEIDLKAYLSYLVGTAREKRLDVKSLPNIYLLHQSDGQEDDIAYKAAEIERNKLIDKLEKLLSSKEFEQLVLKTIAFKAERIPQSTYYSYLIKQAEKMNLALDEYTELQKYVVYTAVCEAVDTSRITEEVGILEERLKNIFCANATQGDLDRLSRNKVLIANLLGCSLSGEDYRYYRDHEGSFGTGNFISFIEKHAPRYKMKAKPDATLTELDDFRERMADFYEYSFKRDKAFLENIRFSHARPRDTQNATRTTILITGGFHTENLCTLLKEKNIAYVSIVPRFSNGEGYACPYFRLLAGEGCTVAETIASVVSSTIAIASALNTNLGRIVHGDVAAAVFRLHVRWMIAVAEGRDGLKIKDGDRVLGVVRYDGEPVPYPQQWDTMDLAEAYLTEYDTTPQIAEAQPVSEKVAASPQATAPPADAGPAKPILQNVAHYLFARRRDKERVFMGADVLGRSRQSGLINGQNRLFRGMIVTPDTLSEIMGEGFDVTKTDYGENAFSGVVYTASLYARNPGGPHPQENFVSVIIELDKAKIKDRVPAERITTDTENVFAVKATVPAECITCVWIVDKESSSFVRAQFTAEAALTAKERHVEKLVRVFDRLNRFQGRVSGDEAQNYINGFRVQLDQIIRVVKDDATAIQFAKELMGVLNMAFYNRAIPEMEMLYRELKAALEGISGGRIVDELVGEKFDPSRMRAAENDGTGGDTVVKVMKAGLQAKRISITRVDGKLVEQEVDYCVVYPDVIVGTVAGSTAVSGVSDAATTAKERHVQKLARVFDVIGQLRERGDALGEKSQHAIRIFESQLDQEIRFVENDMTDMAFAKRLMSLLNLALLTMATPGMEALYRELKAAIENISGGTVIDGLVGEKFDPARMRAAATDGTGGDVVLKLTKVGLQATRMAKKRVDGKVVETPVDYVAVYPDVTVGTVSDGTAAPETGREAVGTRGTTTRPAREEPAAPEPGAGSDIQQVKSFQRTIDGLDTGDAVLGEFTKVVQEMRRRPAEGQPVSVTAETVAMLLRAAVTRLERIRGEEKVSIETRDKGPSYIARAFETVRETYRNIAGEIAHQFFTHLRFDLGRGDTDLFFADTASRRSLEGSKIARLFSSRENVGRLLKALSQMRLLFEYGAEKGEFPLEAARRNGIVFEIMPGVYVSPYTHSFRRHIIYEVDSQGHILALLELKIPGEIARFRHIVDESGFRIAKDVCDRFGSQEVMAQPVFTTTYSGEFDIYGQRVAFTDEHPLRVIAFLYQDGIRIGDNMKSPQDLERIVGELSQRLRIDVTEVKSKIIKGIMRAVRALHNCGYVLTVDPSGSADVRTAERGAYRAELFDGIDIDYFVEKGVFRKMRTGDRVYGLGDDINIAVTVADSAESLEERVHALLDKKGVPAGMREEVMDIITKIFTGEIMDEPVVGDMHPGNLKIVLDGENIKVVQVADVEASAKPEETILNRVAGFELAAIFEDLETLGFDVSDEKRLIQEADQELRDIQQRKIPGEPVPGAEASVGRDAVYTGDIHGNLPGLRNILEAAGLIKKGRTWREDRWTGGDRVLLNTGDIMDRGPYAKQAREYLAGLRMQARRDGGDIIRLLGNHDIAHIAGILIRPMDLMNTGFWQQAGVEDFKNKTVTAAHVINGRLWVHGVLTPEMETILTNEIQGEQQVAPSEVTNEMLAERINAIVADAIAKNDFKHELFGKHGIFWTRFEHVIDAGELRTQGIGHDMQKSVRLEGGHKLLGVDLGMIKGNLGWAAETPSGRIYKYKLENGVIKRKLLLDRPETTAQALLANIFEKRFPRLNAVIRALVSPGTLFHEGGHLYTAWGDGQRATEVHLFRGEVRGITGDPRKVGGIAGNIFGIMGTLLAFMGLQHLGFDSILPTALLAWFGLANVAMLITEVVGYGFGQGDLAGERFDLGARGDMSQFEEEIADIESVMNASLAISSDVTRLRDNRTEMRALMDNVEAVLDKIIVMEKTLPRQPEKEIQERTREFHAIAERANTLQRDSAQLLASIEEAATRSDLDPGVREKYLQEARHLDSEIVDMWKAVMDRQDAVLGQVDLIVTGLASERHAAHMQVLRLEELLARFVETERLAMSGKVGFSALTKLMAEINDIAMVLWSQLGLFEGRMRGHVRGLLDVAESYSSLMKRLSPLGQSIDDAIEEMVDGMFEDEETSDAAKQGVGSTIHEIFKTNSGLLRDMLAGRDSNDINEKAKEAGGTKHFDAGEWFRDYDHVAGHDRYYHELVRQFAYLRYGLRREFGIETEISPFDNELVFTQTGDVSLSGEDYIAAEILQQSCEHLFHEIQNARKHMDLVVMAQSREPMLAALRANMDVSFTLEEGRLHAESDADYAIEYDDGMGTKRQMTLQDLIREYNLLTLAIDIDEARVVLMFLHSSEELEAQQSEFITAMESHLGNAEFRMEALKILDTIATHDIRWPYGPLRADDVGHLNITELVIDDEGGYIVANGSRSHIEKVTRDGETYYLIVPGSVAEATLQTGRTELISEIERIGSIFGTVVDGNINAIKDGLVSYYEAKGVSGGERFAMAFLDTVKAFERIEPDRKNSSTLFAIETVFHSMLRTADPVASADTLTRIADRLAAVTSVPAENRLTFMKWICNRSGDDVEHILSYLAEPSILAAILQNVVTRDLNFSTVADGLVLLGRGAVYEGTVLTWEAFAGMLTGDRRFQNTQFLADFFTMLSDYTQKANSMRNHFQRGYETLPSQKSAWSYERVAGLPTKDLLRDVPGTRRFSGNIAVHVIRNTLLTICLRLGYLTSAEELKRLNPEGIYETILQEGRAARVPSAHAHFAVNGAFIQAEDFAFAYPVEMLLENQVYFDDPMDSSADWAINSISSDEAVKIPVGNAILLAPRRREAEIRALYAELGLPGIENVFFYEGADISDGVEELKKFIQAQATSDAIYISDLPRPLRAGDKSYKLAMAPGVTREVLYVTGKGTMQFDKMTGPAVIARETALAALLAPIVGGIGLWGSLLLENSLPQAICWSMIAISSIPLALQMMRARRLSGWITPAAYPHGSVQDVFMHSIEDFGPVIGPSVFVHELVHKVNAAGPLARRVQSRRLRAAGRFIDEAMAYSAEYITAVPLTALAALVSAFVYPIRYIGIKSLMVLIDRGSPIEKFTADDSVRVREIAIGGESALIPFPVDPGKEERIQRIEDFLSYEGGFKGLSYGGVFDDAFSKRRSAGVVEVLDRAVRESRAIDPLLSETLQTIASIVWSTTRIKDNMRARQEIHDAIENLNNTWLNDGIPLQLGFVGYSGHNLLIRPFRIRGINAYAVDGRKDPNIVLYGEYLGSERLDELPAAQSVHPQKLLVRMWSLDDEATRIWNTLRGGDYTRYASALRTYAVNRIIRKEFGHLTGEREIRDVLYLLLEMHELSHCENKLQGVSERLRNNVEALRGYLGDSNITYRYFTSVEEAAPMTAEEELVYLTELALSPFVGYSLLNLRQVRGSPFSPHQGAAMKIEESLSEIGPSLDEVLKQLAHEYLLSDNRFIPRSLRSHFRGIGERIQSIAMDEHKKVMEAVGSRTPIDGGVVRRVAGAIRRKARHRWPAVTARESRIAAIAAPVVGAVGAGASLLLISSIPLAAFFGMVALSAIPLAAQTVKARRIAGEDGRAASPDERFTVILDTFGPVIGPLVFVHELVHRRMAREGLAELGMTGHYIEEGLAYAAEYVAAVPVVIGSLVAAGVSRMLGRPYTFSGRLLAGYAREENTVDFLITHLTLIRRGHRLSVPNVYAATPEVRHAIWKENITTQLESIFGLSLPVTDAFIAQLDKLWVETCREIEAAGKSIDQVAVESIAVLKHLKLDTELAVPGAARGIPGRFFDSIMPALWIDKKMEIVETEMVSPDDQMVDGIAQEVLAASPVQDNEKLVRLYNEVLGDIKNDRIILTSADGSKAEWDEPSMRRLLLFVRECLEILNEVPAGILEKGAVKLPFTIESCTRAYGKVAEGKIKISINRHEERSRVFEAGDSGVTDKGALSDTVIHETIGHMLTFTPRADDPDGFALSIEDWQTIAGFVLGENEVAAFTADYIRKNARQQEETGKVDARFAQVSEAIAYAVMNSARNGYAHGNVARIRAILAKSYLTAADGRQYVYNERGDHRWAAVTPAWVKTFSTSIQERLDASLARNDTVSFLAQYLMLRQEGYNVPMPRAVPDRTARIQAWVRCMQLLMNTFDLATLVNPGFIEDVDRLWVQVSRRSGNKFKNVDELAQRKLAVLREIARSTDGRAPSVTARGTRRAAIAAPVIGGAGIATSLLLLSSTPLAAFFGMVALSSIPLVSQMVKARRLAGLTGRAATPQQTFTEIIANFGPVIGPIVFLHELVHTMTGRIGISEGSRFGEALAYGAEHVLAVPVVLFSAILYAFTRLANIPGEGRRAVAGQMPERECRIASRRIARELGLRDLRGTYPHDQMYGYGRSLFPVEKWGEANTIFFVRIGHLFFLYENDAGRLSPELVQSLGDNLIVLKHDLRRHRAFFFEWGNWSISTIIAMMVNGVRGKRVIDCGAGEGVLSIVALKLGATSVDVVEIKEERLRGASEQLRLNNYTNFRTHRADLTETATLAKMVPQVDEETVIVSNVGTHPDQWEATNADSIKLIDVIRNVTLFIGSGDLVILGEQSEAIESDQELIRQKGFTMERSNAYVEATPPAGRSKRHYVAWAATAKPDQAAAVRARQEAGTPQIAQEVLRAFEAAQAATGIVPRLERAAAVSMNALIALISDIALHRPDVGEELYEWIQGFVGMLSPTQKTSFHFMLTERVKQDMGLAEVDDVKLGRAISRTIGALHVNRQDLLGRVRNDVPALLVEEAEDGRFRVVRNPGFFEPTISQDIVDSYRRRVQELIDIDPQLGSFLAQPENAARFFDYFALSDYQLVLVHHAHKENAPEVRKFVREYFSAALSGERNVSYRQFALDQIRETAPDRRQVLVAGKGPGRVVARTEATAADWGNPDVMIVDEKGYQLEHGREIPGRPGTYYPGEKMILARWKGRIFFLYTSRSHIVHGTEVRQWRNCDGFALGVLSKSSPQNLDDFSGRTNILLDDLADSGKIQFRTLRGGELNRLMVGDAPDGMHGINGVLRGRMKYARLTPAAQARVEQERHLGAKSDTSELKSAFTGTIWVEAGVYTYGIWVDRASGKVFVQAFNKKDGAMLYRESAFAIGETVTVGRTEHYPVEDGTLSRQHFSFAVAEAAAGQLAFEIKDLGSRHGTAVHFTPGSGLVGAMHERAAGEETTVDPARRFHALQRLLAMRGLDIGLWADGQREEFRDELRDALRTLGILNDTQVESVMAGMIVVTPEGVSLEKTRGTKRTRIGAGIIGRRDGSLEILIPQETLEKALAGDRNALGDITHELVERELVGAGMTFNEAHHFALRAREAWRDRGAEGFAEIMQEARNPDREGQFEQSFETIVPQVLSRLGIAGDGLANISNKQFAQIVDGFIAGLKQNGWNPSLQFEASFTRTLRAMLTRNKVYGRGKDDPGFKGWIGHFNQKDLILVLQRLHTLTRDMATFGMPEEFLNAASLRKMFAGVRVSGADRLGILSGLGLAGETWQRTEPNGTVLTMLKEGRTAEVLLRLESARPAEEVLSDLKAISVYFGIDIATMERNLLSNIMEHINLTREAMLSNNTRYIERLGDGRMVIKGTLVDGLEHAGVSDRDLIIRFITAVLRDPDAATGAFSQEVAGLLQQIVWAHMGEGIQSMLRACAHLERQGITVDSFIARGFDGVVLHGVRDARHGGGEVAIKVNFIKGTDIFGDEVYVIRDIAQGTRNHPNFVTNLSVESAGFGRGEEIVIEVNEFVRGVRLQELVTRADIWNTHMGDIISALLQIMRGDVFLTDRMGRVNMDVRNMRNFIVTGDGVVKLVDFGNVRELRSMLEKERRTVLAEHKQRLILLAVRMMSGVLMQSLIAGSSPQVRAAQRDLFIDLCVKRFGEDARGAATRAIDMLYAAWDEGGDDITGLSRGLRTIRNELARRTGPAARLVGAMHEAVDVTEVPSDEEIAEEVLTGSSVGDLAQKLGVENTLALLTFAESVQMKGTIKVYERNYLSLEARAVTFDPRIFADIMTPEQVEAMRQTAAALIRAENEKKIGRKKEEAQEKLKPLIEGLERIRSLIEGGHVSYEELKKIIELSAGRIEAACRYLSELSPVVQAHGAQDIITMSLNNAESRYSDIIGPADTFGWLATPEYRDLLIRYGSRVFLVLSELMSKSRTRSLVSAAESFEKAFQLIQEQASTGASAEEIEKSATNVLSDSGNWLLYVYSHDNRKGNARNALEYTYLIDRLGMSVVKALSASGGGLKSTSKNVRTFGIDRLSGDEMEVVREFFENESFKGAAAHADRLYLYIKRLTENARAIASNRKQARRMRAIADVISRADRDYLAFARSVFYGGRGTDYSVYAMYLLMLSEEDFEEDVRDIAQALEIPTEGKDVVQLIREIDGKVTTVAVKKQYVAGFDFETEKTELMVPGEHEGVLIQAIRSILEAGRDVDMQGLKARIEEMSKQIDALDEEFLGSHGVPEGLRKQLQDPEKRAEAKKNIVGFIFKKFELTPQETMALLSVVLHGMDAGLLMKYVGGSASFEERNLALTRLGEAGRYLTDRMTDVGLGALAGKLRANEEWKAIAKLKEILQKHVDKKEKATKKIELVFRQKNLLALYQGAYSGTCFGDHPYDMARDDIFIVNILSNGKLAGSVLFNIQGDKLVMIGCDPSEALVGSWSNEKKHEFIDAMMQKIYTFATRNGLTLLISDQAGGLSNRDEFEEYIMKQYARSILSRVKLEKRVYHPSYEYEVTSARGVKNLEAEPEEAQPMPPMGGGMSATQLAAFVQKSTPAEIVTYLSDGLWMYADTVRDILRDAGETGKLARFEQLLAKTQGTYVSSAGVRTISMSPGEWRAAGENHSHPLVPVVLGKDTTNKPAETVPAVEQYVDTGKRDVITEPTVVGFGCGPCIGLIIYNTRTQKAYVSHYADTENIMATRTVIDAALADADMGTGDEIEVIVFGTAVQYEMERALLEGVDEIKEDAEISLAAREAVVSYLKESGFTTIYQIFPEQTGPAAVDLNFDTGKGIAYIQLKIYGDIPDEVPLVTIRDYIVLLEKAVSAKPEEPAQPKAKSKEEETRTNATVDAFTSVNRKSDVVRVVVGVPAAKGADGLADRRVYDDTARQIGGELADSGFSMLKGDTYYREMDKRQIVLFEIDIDSPAQTAENYREAVESAEKGLPTGGRIVFYAPQMKVGPQLAKEAQEYYSARKHISIVPDAYTDATYPDLCVRAALARHISFYYNGNDRQSALAAINMLLRQVSDNILVTSIEQIFNILTPLRIRPVVFEDIRDWQTMQRSVATAL